MRPPTRRARSAATAVGWWCVPPMHTQDRPFGFVDFGARHGARSRRQQRRRESCDFVLVVRAGKNGRGSRPCWAHPTRLHEARCSIRIQEIEVMAAMRSMATKRPTLTKNLPAMRRSNSTICCSPRDPRIQANLKKRKPPLRRTAMPQRADCAAQLYAGLHGRSSALARRRALRSARTAGIAAGLGGSCGH